MFDGFHFTCAVKISRGVFINGQSYDRAFVASCEHLQLGIPMSFYPEPPIGMHT